jgi:hypothetical protein
MSDFGRTRWLADALDRSHWPSLLAVLIANLLAAIIAERQLDQKAVTARLGLNVPVQKNGS